MKAKRSKKSEYLNNKLLYEEIMRAQETGVISNKLGRAFMLLAQRLGSRGNFCGYSYRDEMEGYAVERMVVAVGNFNGVLYQNAFAYMSQVAKNAMIAVIKKEGKLADHRAKMINQAFQDRGRLGVRAS